MDPLLAPLLVVVQHLGALHPFETGLTLVLAFGPFVLLGVVVWIRRRQDAAGLPDAEPAEPAPDQRAR
ncbi:hypothetical protein [Nocardioides nanhaiensis]|uniref:Uncharacterized protein n=1 Tax=Nocardioides nanhaiensis TaxID=1476871 RepID=A0ABP8WWX5_9ACTN